MAQGHKVRLRGLEDATVPAEKPLYLLLKLKVFGMLFYLLIELAQVIRVEIRIAAGCADQCPKAGDGMLKGLALSHQRHARLAACANQPPSTC